MIAMRILLGLALGLFYPIAISLVINYFPVNRITTAIGFLSAGSQLGVALISMTTIFIGMAGWRKTFIAIGIFFIGIGAVTLFAIREPSRGKFSHGYKQSQNSILDVFMTYVKALSVPCIVWNCIAIFCRNWAASAYLGYGLRIFNFYNEKNLVALYSTFATFFGGVFANIFWGWFCDKYYWG
jgi:predicted MFS family arabinose efflux permease